MKRLIVIFIIFLFRIPLFSIEFSNELIPNNGDNYIVDDYPDFNNRGFRYYQDYIKFSSEKDDYKLYVNAVNGNLYYQRLDYEIEEIGFPVRIVFTYNSGSSFRGRYGNFWQLNYALRLISNNLNKNVVFVYPDDKTNIFEFDKITNTYKSEIFFKDSLKILNNGKYEISFYDDILFGSNQKLIAVFDSKDSYFPSEIRDVYDNKIYFNYFESGKISSIFYQSGRVVEFNYLGDLVKKIIVPGGKEISYNYGARGNLISINLPSGKYIGYEYDECDNLTRISTEKNEILISYDDDYRVNTIQNNYSDLIYKIEYDTLKMKTTLILPDSSTRYFIYDEKERSIENGFDNKLFEKIIWNNNYLISSKIDGNGNKITYNYDSLNRIISIIEPDNIQTNFIWENDNLTYNYRNSLISKYKFDKYGKIKSVELPGFDTIDFNRDNSGLLTDIQIGNSINTKLLYDFLGNIKRISINNIDHLLLNYNNDGLLTEITDVYKNKTNYLYDDFNYLTSIKYPDKSEKGIYFSNNYQNVIYAKRNKESYSYYYDKINRLVKIGDELNQFIYLKYNGLNEIEISADSTLDLITFNNFDKIKQIKINNKFLINYNYDNISNLISSNFNGFTRLFKYNSLSLLTEIIYPDNSSKKFTYNSLRKINQYTDEIGNSILYKYDEHGNLSNKIFSNINIKIDYGNNNLPKSVYYNDKKEYDYLYDEYGYLTHYSVLNDSIINFEYNLLGLKIRTIINNQLNAEYHYKYNNLLDSVSYFSGDFLRIEYNDSQIIRKWNKSGFFTSYLYDKKSRLIKVVDANDNESQFTWDRFSNLFLYTDNFIKPKLYKYNFKFDKINIFYPWTASFSYDGINYGSGFQVSKITNSNNNIISFLYDKMNNLSNMIDENTNIISINYQKNSLISSIKNGIGEQYNFTYDFANRLLNINNPEKFDKTFKYNSLNQITELNDYSLKKYLINYHNSNKLLSISSDKYIITYNYNELNQLINFNINDAFRLKYKYDNFGNINMIYNQNEDYIILNYDIFGNVIKKINSDGEIFNYYYTRNNLLRQIISNNKLVYNLNYNNSNNLSKIQLDSINLLSFKYTYVNLISNVLTFDKSIDYQYDLMWQISDYSQNSKLIKQYSYDFAGRVVSIKYSDNQKELFNYDTKGNIIKFTNKNENIIDYSYNYLNKPKNIKWARNDSILINYDNDGNIKKYTYPNNIYTELNWLSFNRLSSINLYNSGTAEIKYSSNDEFNFAKLFFKNGDSSSYYFDKTNRFLGDYEQNFNKLNYDKTGKIVKESVFYNKHNYKFINYSYFDSKLSKIIDGDNVIDFEYPENSILPNILNYNNTLYDVKYDEKQHITKIGNENNSLEFKYNNLGYITEINNNNGILNFEYNNLFQINKLIRNKVYVVDINYNSSNKIAHIFDNYSNSYKLNYDNKGNLIRLTKANDKKIEYLFDNNANLIISRNAAFYETGYFYNKQNLLSSSIFFDYTSNELTYNDLFNVNTMKTNHSLIQNYSFLSKPFEEIINTNIDFFNFFKLSINNEKNTLKINNSIFSQINYDLNNHIKSIVLANNSSINIECNNKLRKIIFPNNFSVVVENIDDLSEEIRIFSSNSLLSEFKVDYNENYKIKLISENSNELLRNNFDEYKRVNSWYKDSVLQDSLIYSADGKIQKIIKKNKTISTNYNDLNQLIQFDDIELSYDLVGNIIKKYYPVENKSIYYEYDFDNKLIYIVNKNNDTINILYSTLGHIVGFKNKYYEFQIPIISNITNNKKSYIKTDSSGSVLEVFELFEFDGLKFAYKYDTKTKDYYYQIFTKNLTSIADIINNKILSYANKISHFKIFLDSISNLDNIYFEGKIYIPSIDLYFDGQKFFDTEIYSYLQDDNFLNQTLNTNCDNMTKNSLNYAIPENSIITNINPFNNRFTNLKNEANPYKVLEEEINLHFNNFSTFNLLSFANYELQKFDPFSLEFNNLLNDDYKLDDKYINVPKLPFDQLDTMLLSSNYRICPENIPERPISRGLNKIYDYIKMSDIPENSVISIVLKKIINIKNPIDEIRYNNIHSVIKPRINIDLIEKVLQYHNSFYPILKQNMKYKKMNPQIIDYYSLFKTYYPNYFEDEKNQNINILKPYSFIYDFDSHYINLENYLDNKTKILNDVVKDNFKNNIKNAFTFNAHDLIPGLENYKEKMIILPYSKNIFPLLYNTYFEKKLINFELK